MHRAKRSAILSWCSISASTRAPASEVRRPPSKAARTGWPAIGDEMALRSCRSMARSTAVRDRLHPSGQARLIGGTEVDVGAWLRGLGLERYARVFRDAELTPETLPELTDADLRELGLPLGPRKAVLKAIRGLAGPPVTAASAEAVRVVMGPDIPAISSEAERRQLTVVFVD